MKKIVTLMAFVALGAAIQSCDDENFAEVEKVVLATDVPNAQTTDAKEDQEAIPGEDN